MSYGEERVGAREDEGVRDQPALPIEPSSFGDLTADEKQWAMFCHMSALLGLVIGGLFFVGPLVCWLVKKDTSRFVDYHGKESLNFQINIVVYSLVCIALAFLLIGFLLLPLVMIYAIVMPIIAGMKANEGQLYEYPYIFRVIK